MKTEKRKTERSVAELATDRAINKKLSRQDLLTLPLLSLVTIGLILVPAELIARKVFSASKTNSLDCLMLSDPGAGTRGIPNSVCTQKIAESSETEYRFNSCGHRAGVECGPKPPGTFRIVLVGSSMAEGLRVSREQTFAASLPDELSRETGRRVEIYNEGIQWGTPHHIDLRFEDILAAQPDMILWTMTPWDVENVWQTVPDASPQEAAGNRAGQRGGLLRETFRQVTTPFRTEPVPRALSDAWTQVVAVLSVRARTVLFLQHYLYKSQTQFVKHSLMQGTAAAFLKAEPSPEWRSLLKQLDVYAVEIEGKARRAGVPLVVTVLPTRAQAAMISMGEWPNGFDPYKLGDEVRSVVESHGGTYIDMLHGFRRVPNPEQLYYPVDGHPTGAGHALLTRLLARELTGGAVPLLTAKPERDSEARSTAYLPR